MPVYEYVCLECDERFSRRRTMSESDAAATCDAGHDARRVFSVPAGVASKGGSTSSAGGADITSAAAWQGSGCGGGCACH